MNEKIAAVVAFAVVVLFLIVLPLNVSAWGIAYTTSNDHELKAGDSIELKFNVQNQVGNEAKKIVLQPSGDSDIVVIKDPQDFYLLPPQSSRDIILTIAIPQDPYDYYRIDLNFISIPLELTDVSLATAKVIPLNITVPGGNPRPITSQEASLSSDSAINNVVKGFNEQEKSAAQGLVVFDTETKPSFVALSVSLMLVLIIAAGIIIYIYIQKKKNDALGL